MLPIDDDEDLHLEEASDNDVTSIKDYKYNKFALHWGEAQKKIAYCYPKVT